MNSRDVRQKFIDYFGKQGHRHIESSRLIPDGDPTLLFTNAGMNQFKNVFVGLEQRDYKRAATSQKCVRAGGKHNDLENVGFTHRHHTFFEMLGNFSFGDYFKKDAIHFAWELVTKDFGLDPKRLYVTVFLDDDEAADIWHKQEGVPKDRIYRFGEADNFWRMGDSGPCGPCSEIFYDLGPEAGTSKDDVMGGPGDRFMEFWNLVFMQFEEDGKGGRKPLPKPSVDTGMGLERLTKILQGKVSNYDTDLFQDIIQVCAKMSGTVYDRKEEVDVALRVLADHARASAFLIGDGVLPSNEGRGYVLRRIMRRAIRFGRQLSEDKSMLPAAVAEVIRKMSPVYKELEANRALIERTVQDEEKRFLATLDQGTHILTQELAKLKGGGTLNGEIAFRLYDTYGFPLDLTRLMAVEKGFKVDELGFEKSFEASKELARASWKGKAMSGDQAFMVSFSQKVQKQSGDTEFTGYSSTEEKDAQVVALSDGRQEVAELRTGDDSAKGAGGEKGSIQTGVIITNKTCFYAEGGGQVGDHGVIRAAGGEAEVLDCTKLNGVFLHHVKMGDGVIRKGEQVQLVVNSRERQATANNHSATHLMHAALRKVLGTHVTQAGSLVEPERLRFDFTHNQPLSKPEIEMIENMVNEEISKGADVKSDVMNHKAAIDSGALALFGEKYGDQVRVIRMGDFSVELCGGTHVTSVGQIRAFKIVSEGGVSAGVRRIEAITGEKVVQYLLAAAREAEQSRQLVGAPTVYASTFSGKSAKDNALTTPAAITQQQEEIKRLKRDVQSQKGKSVDVDTIAGSATSFNGGRFVFADIPMDDRKVLSDLADRLQDKLKDAIVVLVGQGDGSHPVIVSVSKSLTGRYNAGKILGEVASALGGKGGGRPDFAQGAVPSLQNLGQAKAKAESIVSS